MLKRFLFPLFLLVFGLPAFAQTDAEYLKQALLNLYAKTELTAITYDYQYRDGLSSVAGFLKEGNSISFNIYLNDGQDYVVIGGGDKDVNDIDIIVTDEDGNVIDKDDQSDNNPVVAFTAPHSGVYTFKLKLYDCDASGSFCGMAFMQKSGGIKPVTDKFDQALDKMVKAVNYVDDKIGTKFLDREGEICFYGFTFASDESSSTVNGIDLNPEENYLFMAMGDDEINDIDLVLLDNDGSKIDEDTEDDPTPIIKYEAPSSPEPLSLKVKNISSPDNSVIFAVALED